jgi:photosystem I subunit 10
VRASYLGSATNQIMVLSTFLPLVAGRFGLAPTSTRHTNPGLKLLPTDKSAGLYSGDPAGELPGH